MEIKITTEIDDHNAMAIKEILSSYNVSHTTHLSACINEALEITLVEEGEVIGGILGRSLWGTLEIQNLAVKESHRGQGLGKKLMLVAEQVAVERNCKYISLNTFSFQASDFYQSLGYEIFAEEKDYPLGYSKIYLRKVLM
ncbi:MULTISPECIES: GNAT family N-acetyltransferase [Myroides]|uniref:GNAT family N-acetyltransferase n=1 Tax=Myroides albus TaxID=2562892 RepID=A0A6I3LKY5_9FLAO|nr:MULTISPECIES: GNAT family N-acetyltransferase [Myroides]MTG98166.1 GNAT family N-acetyltransferase [Myroides albus]MVX35332.1 GNAT family N-acetyltransferase [Myroides sp. LoEW2-1]